jgi:hypothetical protein
LQDIKQAAKRKASFGQTVSAVLWSFFGVRKGRDHDHDMAQLNPIHVAIVGVIAGIGFVLVLLAVVNAIVK